MGNEHQLQLLSDQQLH